jgi:3-keto-disaccharide hydrolase
MFRTWTLLAGLGLLALLAPRARTDEPKGKTIQPFNGLDLKGWKFKGSKEKSKWVVGRATLDEKNPRKFNVTVIRPEADGGPGARLLINASGSVDIYTEQKFGDCTVEVEFMIPKGSNSGVYLMGEYEVQILDSYGKKKVGPGDLGGLYGTAAPRVNAAKKPGEWQTFVIDFQAPRFKDGKKVANARFVKVTLNGTVIQENVDVPGPTGGGMTGEAPTGPLKLQGNHGAVAFRNIRITVP